VSPERRPLHRAERAVVYGLLGWAMEVAFTGVGNVLDGRQRDWRLQGHSYLWMAPIYGSAAYLYEPVRDALRRRSRWQRAVAYGAGFIAAEWTSGVALRKLTGTIPWDYTGHSRFTAGGGATRFDYLPLWMALGLLMEPLDDQLRTVPVRPVGAIAGS
jgi:hypothetical protein